MSTKTALCATVSAKVARMEVIQEVIQCLLRPLFLDDCHKDCKYAWGHRDLDIQLEYFHSHNLHVHPQELPSLC